MKIIKADGTETDYAREKIERSLRRAGAKRDVIETVIDQTEEIIFPGMTTKELYKVVFKNLKRLTKGTAGKYGLKRAIMGLGPTGFPFEQFLSAVLEAEGYSCATNQTVRGRCVNHEVDIVAKKNKEAFMIECKFHGSEGSTCDIKQALYVYARFLDVENGADGRFHGGWLATNTRLTSDAIKYAHCVGLNFLSWNFPNKNSLREMVDRNGMYPITCLTSLNKQEKQKLLKKGVVLCRTLCESPALLKGIGVSSARKKIISSEAETICSTNCEES